MSKAMHRKAIIRKIDDYLKVFVFFDHNFVFSQFKLFPEQTEITPE